MLTLSKILLGIFTVLLVAIFFIGGTFISYNNQEVDLRTAIETKQKDNENEFDNMYKKIAQVAQVTDAQKNALKEIIVGYADARTPNKSNGAIMNWIQEAVPTVNLETYTNLQNIIISSRDNFTQRQKELLDLNRQHTILIRQFPSGLFLSILGRKELQVTIVTSSKTEKSFASGKDDDINVFGK